MIQLAVSDREILECYGVMKELRPHLEKDKFVPTVKAMQKEGFQLASMQDGEGGVVAVVGFRVYTNLFLGKNLYVDDLVTAAQARSMGYGEAIMRWLKDKAMKMDCKCIHLDSGTQRDQAERSST
jgi:hypothetical protein